MPAAACVCVCVYTCNMREGDTEGTIRKKFAENIERNSVHGSDAVETAAQEIPFFFSTAELI